MGAGDGRSRRYGRAAARAEPSSEAPGQLPEPTESVYALASARKTLRMGAKDFLEAIGLGMPVYFAAATYFFFGWLDRNASAEANRAISGLLKSQRYMRFEAQRAVVDAFDCIYTSRLLSIRGILRSTFISSVIWIGFSISKALFSSEHRSVFISAFVSDPKGETLSEIAFLFIFVLSDYVSLLTVRRYLDIRFRHLLIGLVSAVAFGIAVKAYAFASGAINIL
jgi:hypothetical protein